MQFSGLKRSYKDWYDGYIERIENKQRISLSTHAYQTLSDDFSIFHPQKAAVLKEGELPSPFINRIFSCFKSSAQSSIAQAIQNQKILYKAALQDMQDDEARQAAIKLLLSSFRQQLTEKQMQRCSKKDYTFSIRINSENQEYLLSDEGQAEGPAYQDKIGAYIKAVLEEYCELTYAERERIYFKTQLDEICLAINEKKLLKITLHSKNLRNKKAVNKTMYVKPLRLQQDTEQLYNYLVGMTAFHREGRWEIGSVRLSSIQDCKRQEHPISISDKTRRRIEEAIEVKGVAFISDKKGPLTIKVAFTEEGEKLFRSMLHLRPRPIGTPNENIYTFSCTSRQAKIYFSRFGHDAKIIEPLSLADKLKQLFTAAAKQYD